MLDKNILAVATQIRGNNSPKLELNNFYMNEEDLVVTDTRFLLIAKHGMVEADGEFLLVNPKAKHPLSSSGFMTLVGNEIYGVNTEMVAGYPKYQRIIPSVTQNKTLRDPLDGLTLLYKLTAEYGVVLDYVSYAALFKKIAKIEFTGYSYDTPTGPISIFNDDVQIVIMPMNLDEVVL